VTIVAAPPTADQRVEVTPERARYLRKRRRGRFFGLRVALAVVVTVVMFFPFYWMLVTAFSDKGDVYSPGLHWFPEHFTFDNFTLPIREYPVWTWMRNSFVITIAVTAISVVLNLLAGYAFAKLPFRGRNAVFLLLLSTMMIPIQAIMVPLFKLTIQLHLFGTIWAVILPEAAAAFGIFLARQFFLAIPDELLEAARVDGAGQFRTFRSIVLPLSKPLIAVLTLLSFMSEWNAFAWPLVALFSSQDLFTLPLGLNTDLKGQYVANYGAIMAVSIIAVLPMVILFLAFQRYFVQGLARSGIK
jgi:multiple sugar transport system permease protein